MQVSVYEGPMLVGTALLEHLDPPMGVAFGPFLPASGYAAGAHANVVEGDYMGDKGVALAATADHHGLLAASVAIEDWAAAEFGKQLTLFFADGANFAALFATHPDYRAYYSDLGNGG